MWYNSHGNRPKQGHSINKKDSRHQPKAEKVPHKQELNQNSSKTNNHRKAHERSALRTKEESPKRYTKDT